MSAVQSSSLIIDQLTEAGVPSILVALTTQYGNKTIVPVCETALTFATIAGTKTLRLDTIELIKKLGYTVKVRQDLPVEL